LADPLAWLATALQAQDEARMERLWSLAGGNLALLERCVACFVHRYPSAPAAAMYKRRLQELRWRRYRRRGLIGSAAAACLFLGVYAYDALGYHSASQFEREHGTEPVAALQHWQSYRAWHPTRHVLRPGSADREAERLRELEERVRQQQIEEKLGELRRRAADADADPEAVWQQFLGFRS